MSAVLARTVSVGFTYSYAIAGFSTPVDISTAGEKQSTTISATARNTKDR